MADGRDELRAKLAARLAALKIMREPKVRPDEPLAEKPPAIVASHQCDGAAAAARGWLAGDAARPGKAEGVAGRIPPHTGRQAARQPAR